MTDHDDARAIADQLRRTGQASHTYTDADERDQLRAAGRHAGRILGRPVRTFARAKAVHIVLTDWGDHNPLEHQLTDIKAKKAIDRAMFGGSEASIHMR